MQSKGIVRLPGYRGRGKPDEEYCKALRELCINAVYAEHSIEGEPITITGVQQFVLNQISSLRTLGLWRWRTPLRRTTERRIQEAADPRFYKKGEPPKIVAVTAGVYAVNPELIEK